MTLTIIKNDIKAFAKKKHGYMTGYIAMQEDFNKRLAAGMIGEQRAKQELEKYKAEGNTYARTTYNQIIDNIDRVHEQELAKLKEKELSVTADDVAELNLLASMEMTKDELVTYYEKFKHKPLAIKKLNEIAKQQPELFVNMQDYTAEQALTNLIDFFKQQLAFFEGRLQINGDKILAVTMDMVVSAEVTALDARLGEYLDL
ncbi:hypothetical protein [Streptococcus sp. E17BB]|uniref:hypothetical protein n=2 Tax=unclassified Streptococcus TaxID=2608887 RepID=UPI00359EE750